MQIYKKIIGQDLREFWTNSGRIYVANTGRNEGNATDEMTEKITAYNFVKMLRIKGEMRNNAKQTSSMAG